MGENLDKKLYRFSVGQIITDMFYRGMPAKRSDGLNGSILHYRLGFTNDQVYCRYLELSDAYVLLCGAPDRISLEDKLYVDELKTTYSNSIDKMKRVGETQLQLYMFITGITDGRLYIYLKDQKRLLDPIHYKYDELKVYDIMYKYLAMKKYLEEMVNK